MKNLSKPLFNMEQINVYCEAGAKIEHVGMKHYIDSGKTLFFVQFLLDEKYQDIKTIWMEDSRER